MTNQYRVNNKTTDNCYDSTVVSAIGIKEYLIKSLENRKALIKKAKKQNRLNDAQLELLKVKK